MGIYNAAVMLGSSYDAAYIIGQSSTSIDEGSTVTFTVTTANVADGTTLYWTTYGSPAIGASDFSDNATSGSFTITNGSGSVSRTLANDATTEGTESFQLQIRTGSISGTVVATSDSVSINDTSVAPQPFSSNVVLVSGGGAGGAFGGGGGGGAMYDNPGTLATLTPYTFTVGAGGARSPGQGNPGSSSSTSALSVGTLTGGGGGGNRTDPTSTPARHAVPGNPSTHGSGGGASAYDNAPSGTGGTGGPYGMPGGNTTSPGWGSAGGGGAQPTNGTGAPGGNGSTGGNGGDGNLTFMPTPGGPFAGGGGGGNYNNGTVGTGGPGGGGPGYGGPGGSQSPPTIDGSPNTGGGGGGSNLSSGGAGGSGIIIVYKPSSYTFSNPGGGLTFTNYPDRVEITAGTGTGLFS